MGGEMGACPDWYELIQSAKYLGVAPWELLTQARWWRETAGKCIDAESRANDILKAHGK